MLSMLPTFTSTGYKYATIFIYNYAHLYPKYSGICLGVLLPHPWTPLIIPSHFALGSRLPVLPHRRNASIRFDFGTLSLLSFWWFAFCFLLLAACLFLLACRVFGFCLDGKLQGFWHSFTALHPCTWFVQPKCLIKRELSTLARSFLYLPLSHSLSLSHSVSRRAWEWRWAKSKIFDFLDDEIANPAMQMDSQVRFVCHASWFS